MKDVSKWDPLAQQACKAEAAGDGDIHAARALVDTIYITLNNTKGCTSSDDANSRFGGTLLFRIVAKTPIQVKDGNVWRYYYKIGCCHRAATLK